MFRIFVVVLAALTVAACAKRGAVTIGPESAALAAGATLETVFVATDRVYTGGADLYGPQRVSTPSFAQFTVSVPPDREVGSLTWPGGAPDFSTDFVTVSAERLGRRDFVSQVNRELAAFPPGSREVLLYIHGFNTNYPEAFYRQAQMMHDFDVTGVALTFAWASGGNPLAYVHDRDSALFARHALVQLIEGLQETRAERVVIVAHSMGGLLTVEALRDIALRGDAPPWGNLGAVILISPDIAVDVFRSQAVDIGSLPKPFVVFTSEQDRALALSSTISRQRDRLGSLPDPAPLAELDVTFVNLTEFRGGDPFHHMTAVTSPASVAILARVHDLSKTLAVDQVARQGLLPGTVIAVQNATEVVLTPGVQ